MNLENTILLMTRLVGITMLLQGFEIFSLTRRREFFAVWSDRNLKTEFAKSLPFADLLMACFLSQNAFRGVALFQILAAFSCLCFPSPLIIVLLFCTQLIICVRFRGTFNGGSDMMLFVVLTGLFFATFFKNPDIQKWGPIYVAIHLGYSYFKAGLAKIIRREWRTGAALPAFLERSLFPDMRRLGAWLRDQKTLSFILCWLVLIFELGAVTLPFQGSWTFSYFATALAFHLAVFFAFGLNRFFWAWLCAWPTIFYCSYLLN